MNILNVIFLPNTWSCSLCACGLFYLIIIHSIRVFVFLRNIIYNWTMRCCPYTWVSPLISYAYPTFVWRVFLLCLCIPCIPVFIVTWYTTFFTWHLEGKYVFLQLQTCYIAEGHYPRNFQLIFHSPNQQRFYVRNF